MANNFNELLQTLQTEKLTTENYLKEKKEHLIKAKELLSLKEDELEKVNNYLILLLNVISALKVEITSTESEIEAINYHLNASSDKTKKIEQIKEKLDGIDKNSIFKTNKPNFNVSIQSVGDVKKLAESLSTVKDESESKIIENNITEKSVEISTSKEASDVKIEKVERVVNSKDYSADWVKVCNSNTEDKDFCYLQLVESNCKKPADEVNIDVWRRRVLVKYYMESGLSTVSSILSRYNKYADKYKTLKATDSSISKDMKRIFDGDFKLEVVVYAKNIFEEFRPASMLTSEEICKINEAISKLDGKKMKKSNLIDKIQDFARLNLSNMSTYKLRAVKSFVEEQLDN